MIILVAATLLLGLILRLIVLNQSFWLDEAIGAIAVKSFNYREIISQFIRGDNHPPLYYLTLKAWSSLFGYSEVALRSLSVILGVGTILLVYFIARELFKKDKFLVAISTIFLATSSLHIYYSQEARMYIMAGFFAALAVLSFLKTFGERVKTIWWGIYAISLPLMMLSDYMPVFLLPVFWLYPLIVKRNKAWWLRFFVSYLPLVVLGLIWLPTFLLQSQTGRAMLIVFPAWKSVAGGATLKQLGLVWVKFVMGRISLANKPLYYLSIAVVSVPFVFVLSKASYLWKKIKFVWFWLTIPIALGFITSFWFPAFIYFRYIYVLPAFYLLLAFGIGAFKNRNFKIILVGLILAVNLGGWLVYVSDPNQQRENWRKAVSVIESRLKSGEAVAFEYPEAPAPFKWYAGAGIKVVGLVPKVGATDSEIRAQTNSEVEGVKGIYMFEYLKDLTDPRGIARYIIESAGFSKKDVLGGFGGVGAITYFARN